MKWGWVDVLVVLFLIVMMLVVPMALIIFTQLWFGWRALLLLALLGVTVGFWK